MHRYLLVIFIILYLSVIVTKIIINTLNIRHIKKYGKRVPAEFKDDLSVEDMKRAKAYTVLSQRFGILKMLIDKSMMLIFLISGLFAWYASLFNGINDIIAAMLFFGGLYFISYLFDIPFSYYDKFHLEEEFGFNRSTVKIWIGDLIKSFFVGIILGGLLLLGIVLMIKYLPGTWWIFGWLLTLAFSLFTVLIYPAFIVPLFNKLTPIEGKLADRIRKMAKRGGINIDKIFKMDASKRTAKGNAYFAGLGRTKSITLFDTLLESHSDDEIVNVLAHEIGHWRLKHIVKKIVYSQLFSLAGFFIAFLLLNSEIIYDMFGLRSSPFYAGLFIIVVLLEIPAFYLEPLSSALSRRFELEADAFAVHLTGKKESLITGLKRLVKLNLANLYPHPLYAFFTYSHPPILYRLRKIEEIEL